MRGLTRRQFITTATGLALASSSSMAPVQALTVNPRSSWGTNHPPIGPLQSEDVKFLIVHHSASHNGHATSDVPEILRGWFNFHTTTRGWNDIAYNFVVDSAGVVWEGRQGSLAGPVAGDATGGNQGYTQLVCVIGDFNTAYPGQIPLNSLVSVLAWLGERHGVSTSAGSKVAFTSRGSNKWPAGTMVTTPTITGHRSMSETTCPGDNLNSYVVAGLMSDVEAIRSGASPGTSEPPSSTSAARPITTIVGIEPSTTTGVTFTSTTTATTTPVSPAPTTVEADLLPTPASPLSSIVATVSDGVDPVSVDPVSIVVKPTTTTTSPVLAGGSPRPPSDSPLLRGAAVLAGVATVLLLWRARRLNR